jgi:hypothetical protein
MVLFLYRAIHAPDNQLAGGPPRTQRQAGTRRQGGGGLPGRQIAQRPGRRAHRGQEERRAYTQTARRVAEVLRRALGQGPGRAT